VRDDKPFGGQAPPGAVFYYSRDRAGEHPQAHLAGYSGIFQADAYGGYGKLYEAGRNAGPIVEAACWVVRLRWRPPSRIGFEREMVCALIRKQMSKRDDGYGSVRS
jgi:hypothetical protein